MINHPQHQDIRIGHRARLSELYHSRTNDPPPSTPARHRTREWGGSQSLEMSQDQGCSRMPLEVWPKKLGKEYCPPKLLRAPCPVWASLASPVPMPSNGLNEPRNCIYSASPPSPRPSQAAYSPHNRGCARCERPKSWCTIPPSLPIQ